MKEGKKDQPKENPAKPGTLRSLVTMEIQTGLAQRLVSGRERGEGIEPILGVTGFGRRARLLWQSAAEDDPYADWFLLKIEDSIEFTKKWIDEHAKRIGEVLAAMEGFTVEIAHSLEPIQVPLRFSNPYGYMAAYLVSDFDQLSRAVLTARHLGLIERRRSDEILRASGRAIRRTFNYAVQWRYTGVRRADIRQMNPAAERARDLMGEIPEEILTGQRRAKMAPAIQSEKNPSSPPSKAPPRRGPETRTIKTSRKKVIES